MPYIYTCARASRVLSRDYCYYFTKCFLRIFKHSAVFTRFFLVCCVACVYGARAALRINVALRIARYICYMVTLVSFSWCALLRFFIFFFARARHIACATARARARAMLLFLCRFFLFMRAPAHAHAFVPLSFYIPARIWRSILLVFRFFTFTTGFYLSFMRCIMAWFLYYG